jgi:hypothetical protein
MNLATMVLLLLIGVFAPAARTLQAQKVDENWICPDVRVDCPERDSGRKISFRAKVTLGVPATPVGFKWKVTGGKIIHGQGTEVITVRSTRRKGHIVTATVAVLKIPKSCANSASCSVTIAKE